MSIATFSPLTGKMNNYSILSSRKRTSRFETEDSTIKRQCGSTRMLDRFIAGVTTNKQSSLSAFIASICKSSEEETIPDIGPKLKSEENNTEPDETSETTPAISDQFLLQSPTESQTESDKEEDENEDENSEEDEVSTNEDEPPKNLNSNLDEI